MGMELIDDGTLDTVIRCMDCGEEFRFNYAIGMEDHDGSDGVAGSDADYEAFVASCFDDVLAEHECSTDDDEPTEPTEDDLVTSDHRVFYYHGQRKAFELREQTDGRFIVDASPRRYVKGQYATVERAIRAFMEAEQYWPACWFISDHGNAHRMDLDRA